MGTSGDGIWERRAKPAVTKPLGPGWESQDPLEEEQGVWTRRPQEETQGKTRSLTR